MKALVIDKIQMQLVSEGPDKADALPGQDLNTNGYCLDLQPSIRGAFDTLDQTFGDTNAANINIAGRVSSLQHIADQISYSQCIFPVRVDILSTQPATIFTVVGTRIL